MRPLSTYAAASNKETTQTHIPLASSSNMTLAARCRSRSSCSKRSCSPVVAGVTRTPHRYESSNANGRPDATYALHLQQPTTAVSRIVAKSYPEDLGGCPTGQQPCCPSKRALRPVRQRMGGGFMDDIAHMRGDAIHDIPQGYRPEKQQGQARS